MLSVSRSPRSARAGIWGRGCAGARMIIALKGEYAKISAACARVRMFPLPRELWGLVKNFFEGKGYTERFSSLAISAIFSSTSLGSGVKGGLAQGFTGAPRTLRRVFTAVGKEVAWS